MGIRRLAAVAALSSSLIISTTVPATAVGESTDVTPPVVTSTGLTEGQVIGPYRLFRPVVSDNVGVTSVQVFVNGVYRNNVRRVDGEFADRVYLYNEVHDTDVDVTIRALDAARNHSDLTVRVHTDLVFPTASISPAEKATVGGIATITATDLPPDTARVVLSHAEQEISHATSAPWKMTWDTRVPGQNGAVRITVEDRAGNTTDYGRWYNIDRNGPEIWASTNWIPDVIGPGVGHIGVSYDDPADVSRIEWRIDGVLRSTDQIAKIDFGRVSRTAAVEARVYDAFGNVTVASRKVRVDATPPTVTSATPGQGALVRGNALWTEIKATDASGISDVVVITPNGQQHPLQAAPYRKSVSVVEGPSQLTWRVSDRLRNVTVVRRNVIVDTSPPLLKVTKAPNNGAKVTGAVQMAATAWDRNGIARVELLINGKVAVRDYAAAYQFSINTKKYGKTIKVQLRAYDRAGNMKATPVRTWKR